MLQDWAGECQLNCRRMLDLCATRLAQRFTAFLANNPDTNLIFLAWNIFSRYFTQKLKSIQTMYPQLLVEWSIEVATDWHEMKMATKQFYVAPDTIFRFLSTMSMKSQCGCLCKLAQKIHWTMLDACRKPSKVDRIQSMETLCQALASWDFDHFPRSFYYQPQRMRYYKGNPSQVPYICMVRSPKMGNFTTPVLQTTWFCFNHLMFGSHHSRFELPEIFRNSSQKKTSTLRKAKLGRTSSFQKWSIKLQITELQESSHPPLHRSSLCSWYSCSFQVAGSEVLLKTSSLMSTRNATKSA